MSVLRLKSLLIYLIRALFVLYVYLYLLEWIQKMIIDQREQNRLVTNGETPLTRSISLDTVKPGDNGYQGKMGFSTV